MERVDFYLLLNLLSVIVAVFSALVSWHRRHIEGGLALFFLMLAVAYWCLFSAFELYAVTIPEKIFWSQVAYPGTVATPVLFMALAMSYSGKSKWLTRRSLFLLFIIPTISVVLAATNNQHHLIWTDFIPNPEYPRVLQYEHGAFFWFGVIGYSYVCMLLGTYHFLRSVLRLAKTYRRQSITMVIAALIPWTGNLLYVFKSHPLHGIDLTPIGFSIGGVIAVYAIFHFKLLDLVPVARDVLIENMLDGVILLDNQNRVIDINPSALRLINLDENEAIGKNAEVFLGEQIALSSQTNPVQTVNTQLAWGADQDTFLDMTIIPIQEQLTPSSGKLLILRDVTAQKNAEMELQEANRQLRSQISEINKLQEDLREQAIRDPLTGLYNRRFFNEILELELLQAKQTHQPVSLVMLDLDGFKNFNDTYGHIAGDDMLRKLGEILRLQTRQSDFACRYGGEEFIVVMPGASPNAVMKRVEEWRAAYANARVRCGSLELQNTFSAGVAVFPFHAENSDDLLKAVDRALYIAKSSGRNRVATIETLQ